nr:MAG TPA: hypothetical protein [Caudoviricetes sp.]
MFFRCFLVHVRMTIFERFVFPIPQFCGRFVWDSSKIWICGLYWAFICSGGSYRFDVF